MLTFQNTAGVGVQVSHSCLRLRCCEEELLMDLTISIALVALDFPLAMSHCRDVRKKKWVKREKIQRRVFINIAYRMSHHFPVVSGGFVFCLISSLSDPAIDVMFVKVAICKNWLPCSNQSSILHEYTATCC